MSGIREKYCVDTPRTPEQLFAFICAVANKHEVQYWLDEAGTDSEKLSVILYMAREGLRNLRMAD